MSTKKHSTSGSRPNEVVFPSPLYVSHWLNDDFFVVGGGGGETKFGMANFIVLFEVIKPEKADSDCWKQRASLDFGDKVIWCTSDVETIQTPSKSESKDEAKPHIFQFAVSSKDCCFLVVCDVKAGTMVKSTEGALQFDVVNGDKKPIGTTSSGLVLAAQDDNSIAVFRTEELKRSANADKDGKEGEPVKKMTEISKWDETQLWRGRIRSVLTKSVTETLTVMVTASEDKRILCMLLSGSAKASTSKIDIQQVVVVTEQHLKLPFSLMSSSFKTMHWDPVRGSTALVLNVFNARTADSHLIQVDDVVQEGGKGKSSGKKVVFNDSHRFMVPKDGVSDLALQSFGALAGTVEGALIYLHRNVGGEITGVGQTRPLHGIPISSVCVTGGGAVLSTDIGQRANLTSLGRSSAKATKVHSTLPPTFVRPGWHKKVALLFVLLVVAGLLFVMMSSPVA